MSTCVCGRTTRRPWCDNSCSLSESQYQERCERLAELYRGLGTNAVNTHHNHKDNHEQNQ